VKGEGFYVGVDCGGTNLRAAAMRATAIRADGDLPGGARNALVEFSAELSCPTGDAQERENGLGEAILALVEGLAVAPELSGAAILGVGVGLPFTCHDGRAWLCRNVEALDPSRLQAALESRWVCPSALMNDVKCAALGESWAGIARGADPFVYLNVGTGLSAALYSGGRVLQGAHHAAGEIAYWVSDPDALGGLTEGCGPLEEEMSGVGLAGAYERASPSGERISARDIFRRAGSGEAMASAVLGRGLSRLYPAIANLCTFADPELLVLGGGVGRALEPRAAEIEAYLRGKVPFPPALAWSALGDRAGLAGAIRLAMLSEIERA